MTNSTHIERIDENLCGRRRGVDPISSGCSHVRGDSEGNRVIEL
jgi:hypothetical protein